MLANILETRINTALLLDCNKRDMEQVIRAYDLSQQALDAFLSQEVSFEEYLDLLEIATVNIDSYLNTVNHNLQIVGID